jgi:hypothetical protein
MAVTPIIKGITTIVWGTNNGLAAPAGAIVESLTLTPKNGSPIEIEDNNGLGAVEVELTDGFNAKASVMYDDAKVWPIEGANVALNIRYNGAAANSVPFGASSVGQSVYANGVVTYTCLVVSVEPALARKKEAMLTLNLTYRPNIAV